MKTATWVSVSRRWLVALVAAVILTAPSVFAAASGADDAGNYTSATFTNGSNGGTGFGAWEINAGPGVLVGLTNSAAITGDIDSTNSLSFVFYGSTNGSYGEAVRFFNAPMVEGDTFSVRFAYNWNGGNRGVNIIDASNSELLNINYGGADELSYTVQGGSGVVIANDYVSTSVVSVVVEQLAGNALDITITRNDGVTTNIVTGALSAPAAKVKCYNGGHAGDNLNYALFVNDLVLTASPIPTLNVSVQDAMAAGMTNVVTITRGGLPLDAETIYLSSSDPLIAAVPATVEFAAGETVTNVTIEGYSLGQVNILATNAIYPDVLVDVTVYDIAYDDSSYYPPGSFANAGNGGLGFQSWIILDNNGAGDGFTNYAGSFIGDSTFGGADVNASSGDAFALYANGDGSPFSYAIRPFSAELAVGQAASFEFGVNYRNGAKGATLQNSGNAIFEVAVYNDDYWYKIGNEPATSLGWAYASDSTIAVEFKRVAGSLYDITISRSGSTPESQPLGLVDLGSTPPNEIRFFNLNTDGGNNENNLYFNRIALYTGEEIPVLSIDGNDGMVLGLTNAFTVTRSGPTDSAVTVDLVSSDPAVASVPASVEIGIGLSNATFEVVGVSTGLTVITADATGAAGAVTAVEVFDIAYDDTTYYPPATFDNSGNGGVGFQTWVLSGNDGAGDGFTNFVGFFVGDSSAVNGNVNSTENTAFGIYANGDGIDSNAPLAEATRPFSAELGIGETMEVSLGVNYRNGAKGLMIQNGGAWLVEVAVYNDDYVYNIRDQGDNAISLGWTYAADSVITVYLSRTGATSYNLKLVRSGGSPQELLVEGITLSQAPDRVRFYVYDTDSGDENNLYVNDLAIYTGTVGQLITDGIPNSWWEQYAVAEIDRVAANDNDNDGVSNLDEYIADTNPEDELSVFPNLVTRISGSGLLSLQTGPTTNSRVYDVWFTTNLLTNPQQWTRVGVTTSGNGGTVSLSVTGDVPYRIYRTGVALP